MKSNANFIALMPANRFFSVSSKRVYLGIGSWWWTAFIWLAVLAAAVTGIVIWNKKHPWKAKESVTVAEGAKEAAGEAAFTEDNESDKKE